MEVPAAAAVAAAAAERAARARSIAWLRARCDAALSSFCGVSFVRACSPSRRARGALAACACELVAPSATIGALAAYESETTRTETDRTDGDAHRAPSLRLVPPLGAPVAEWLSRGRGVLVLSRLSLSSVERRKNHSQSSSTRGGHRLSGQARETDRRAKSALRPGTRAMRLANTRPCPRAMSMCAVRGDPASTHTPDPRAGPHAPR